MGMPWTARWPPSILRPEFRADANYTLDYNHPKDDSMGGSTETFRSDEWQLEQISVGGDIHINNVRGRILTMDGLFATTTPVTMPAPIAGNGTWPERTNMFPKRGAVITGMCSMASTWMPASSSLISDSSVTTTLITGPISRRLSRRTRRGFSTGYASQWFPTKNLKIEPWIINGWQSYARYNSKPGLGGQILWRPKPYLDFVWNNYGLGEDDAGYPGAVHAFTPTTARR